MVEYLVNRWIKENTIERREYQEKIANVAANVNTLVVLPTALGKTIIALLVVTKILDRDPNSKILFLAPTRPLVEQHRRKFEEYLKLGLNLVSVTGKIRPERRAKLYEQGDIVFSTPQCIKNDLEANRIDLAKFALLVVDEAQHSVGNYAYTYVARAFYEATKGRGRILGLTASPGHSPERIAEIKRSLFIQHVELRSERDEDVAAYVKPVTFHWIRVETSEEFKRVRAKLLELKRTIAKELEALGLGKANEIEKLSKPKLLELQNELAKKKSGSKFRLLILLAQLLKLDHALELLETQTARVFFAYLEKLVKEARRRPRSAVGKLVESTSFRELYFLAKDLRDHPKLDALEQIVRKKLKDGAKLMVFAQLRSTVREIVKRLARIEGARVGMLIGQRGEEGMDQRAQLEVTRLFEEGEFNVLVTTSIGEEGLHLGSANVAIFYEPVPSEIRSIQRRGRVGRDVPGEVYVLMTKGTRDEAYYWASYHKEKRMRRLLRKMSKQPTLIEFTVGGENEG